MQFGLIGLLALVYLFYTQAVSTEKIKDTLSLADDIIDNDQYSILKRLNQLNRNLDKIADNDDRISELSKRIKSNIIELEDIHKVIQDMNNGLIINNNKLSEIDEILNHLELLKRKYGGSAASVAQYYNQIMASEEKLEINNEEIQNLDAEVDLREQELFQKAEYISNIRHETALLLEASISDNLQLLNFKNISFNFSKNVVSRSVM